MVRGTAKVLRGAAGAAGSVAGSVARGAMAAAPLVGRGGSDPESAEDGSGEPPSDGTVTPIVPEQPDAPPQESGDDDGPDLDPAAAASPEDLVTREGEDPWTEAEVAEVHEELTRLAADLRAELAALDADLDGLIRSSGEGTGQDSADVGSASSERDHEISLGNNARLMLHQTERALGRLAEGSFGVCEQCGGAIGKMRVMAFPRATLCLSCKQREERR